MTRLEEQIKKSNRWWKLKNLFPENQTIYQIWHDEEIILETLLDIRLKKKILTNQNVGCSTN